MMPEYMTAAACSRDYERKNGAFIHLLERKEWAALNLKGASITNVAG